MMIDSNSSFITGLNKAFATCEIFDGFKHRLIMEISYEI